jgi:hypothetical protein
MKKDLEKIKGFSEGKVDKIKEAGKKMMVGIIILLSRCQSTLTIDSPISMASSQQQNMASSVGAVFESVQVASNWTVF